MRLRAQRGMSLLAAIFLVTIIAALAAFAVTSARATRNATNLQLQADRALAAARAGAEWGAFRALSQNLCTLNQTLNLGQGALRGFQVTVDCVRSRPENSYQVVDITATARWGTFGTPDYSFRRIVARYDEP